ncbi:thiamine pyrophosphate-dependent dehydrogenase E1 component subunit alpha [bacterium]|nr:thiamine pyrophosphate-dependent dehydrogenase E1 component subunit alpha [bacterium]
MSDRDLALYRKMQLIRRAEEKIQERYSENEMKTPVHLCIGQEAVVVGVLDALSPEDQVLGTYRSHGIYLARTNDPRSFFAEIYGRSSAHARGRAGSMHLASPAHGFLGTSAVVGTTIPLALGAAFANQRRKNGRTAAAIFGDGAIDEGVFWESLNYACLARLPVLFVCEDNGLAIHSPAEERHGYDSIEAIVERFRCHVARSDSTDPAVLSDLTREAISKQRETGQPAFLHFRCYRYVEHVGIAEDFDAGYRTRASFEEWKKRDPIQLVRRRLLEGGVERKTVDQIDQEIERELESAIALAKKAPFPPASDLEKDVFA